MIASIAISSSAFANSATWNGGSGSSNNWNDTANWVSGIQPAGGANNSTIHFTQGGRTTSNNDYGDDSQFQQILFDSTITSSSYSLTGSRIKLFDVSGDGITGKIENNSAILQTINFSGALGFSLLLESSFEIDPTAGDLTINNSVLLDFNNPTISVFGNTGHTLTFNGAISQNTAGGLTNQDNNIVVFNAANSYTGATTLLAGELRFGQNGSANSSSILLGDTAVVANNATISLAGSGQTLTSAMTVRSGNTGTMTLRSENTSGTTNQWNGAITLQKGLTAAAINSGATLQIGSTFTGNANTLTIGAANAGIVSLTGSGDNNALAATVNAGTLLLAKSSTAGVHAVGSGLTVNTGGTAQLGGTGGDQIFTTSFVTVNGGTFDINTRSEGVGTVNMTGGSITGTTGVLTGAGYNLDAGSVTAILAGAGVALTKTGTGTLILSGTNTYGSTAGTLTTVANGTVQIGNDSAFGGSILKFIGSGGTTGAVEAVGSAKTLSNNVQISTGSASVNATISGTQNLTINGSVTNFGAASRTLLVTNTGITTLNGNVYLSSENAAARTFTITGNGNTSNVVINGDIKNSDPAVVAAPQANNLVLNNATTTFTLAGNNSYTGTTNLSAGTVNVNSNTAFGASSTVAINGVTLDNTSGLTKTLSNAAYTLGATNSYTGTGGATLDLGTGTMSLNGNTRTWAVNGGVLNIGGIISGSAGNGLTKTGGGTLKLGGANTYSGPTSVNAGTLLVNNATGSGTGTNTVTVSNSGTVLGGTGSIGGNVVISSSASVATASKLQGGNGTTGTTLTVAGALTLNDNSVVQLALGAGGTHSTLARSGINTWTFDSNQAFTFIDQGATAGTYQDIITGIADPTTESSWVITNAGYVGTFTYDGANMDLTLTAVPEPSTWAAALLSLGAIALSQRRRTRGWANLKRATAVRYRFPFRA